MPTYQSGFVIEGIGAGNGLLESFNMVVAFEDNWNLICFKHDSDNYPNANTPCPLIVNTTGIHQPNKEQNNIHPNPSNGVFQVTVSNKQLTEIKMYDVNGKLVLSKSIQPTPNPSKEGNNITVDASPLNEGVYNV